MWSAKESHNIRLLILAVDLPGLVGILFIWGGSTVLHHDLPNIYWHGFIAGAIGLHIAFSQVALSLIAANGDFSERLCSQCARPKKSAPVTP
jgi:hypothetical protein